jgi:transcriptional regulator with XRE-family HTH domain
MEQQMAEDVRKKAFLERVGAEIRGWREAAEVSQQAVGEVFGWGRDAMSKVELGKNNLTLHDYCVVVDFLRDVIPPDHPSLALADSLLGRRPRRRNPSAK